MMYGTRVHIPLSMWPALPLPDSSALLGNWRWIPGGNACRGGRAPSRSWGDTRPWSRTGQSRGRASVPRSPWKNIIRVILGWGDSFIRFMRSIDHVLFLLPWWKHHWIIDLLLCAILGMWVCSLCCIESILTLLNLVVMDTSSELPIGPNFSGLQIFFFNYSAFLFFL